MKSSKKSPLNRRGFLKGAAAGAAAMVGTASGTLAQTPVAAVTELPRPGGALAVETETAPASLDVLSEGRPGSDFMVDVVKSLGIEYICSNSSRRSVLRARLRRRRPRPPLRDNAPSGNAENGKKLYVQYGCYQCHGYAAHGGTGPRLAPRPSAYPAFSKYVRQPTGEMPPYTAKVVTDTQLADIYSFLRSIPQPPPVDSIPLLKDN